MCLLLQCYEFFGRLCLEKLRDEIIIREGFCHIAEVLEMYGIVRRSEDEEQTRVMLAIVREAHRLLRFHERDGRLMNAEPFLRCGMQMSGAMTMYGPSSSTFLMISSG